MILGDLLGGFEKIIFGAESKIEAVIIRTLASVERIIGKKLEQLKRKLLLTVLEFLFYVLSMLFFIGGIILFLLRFFSLDVILMVAGAILFYLALMLKWIR